MPKFALVSDQTNFLNRRHVTWRCESCGHEIIVHEFPNKTLPDRVHMPCDACAMLELEADNNSDMTEDERRAYLLSLH